MAKENSVRNLKKKAEKLFRKNKLIQARDIYIPLCQSVPDDLDSWIKLATIFRTLNDLANAEKCCNHVLAKDNTHTLAIHTYASVLHISGNRPAAINLYLKVLKSDNAPHETYYFIANAYREIGNINNAQLYYEKLLKLEPFHFEVLNNLSALYTSKGMISQSLDLLEKADKAQPGHRFVKNNLAKAYLIQGDAKKSSSISKSILDTGQYEPYIASNYLLSLNYLDLEPNFIYAEHKNWVGKFPQHIENNNFSESFNKLADNAKIKVGILSPDLISHPVSRFIESFFKHYNKNKFSIHCYSDTAAEDSVSADLKPLVDDWSTVNPLTNDQLFQKIQTDEINILIDLVGHTGNNRMPLYALKPAPLQVTYLGYPNTTGLAAMDYRITDTIADPTGLTEKLHTEKLIRLPNCFLAFIPDCPEAAIERKKSLNINNIMFGSFNNLAKTTPEVIALWSKILHAVPNSKLTLKSISTSDPGIKTRYLDLFKQHNINEDRIILLNTRTDKEGHYSCYNDIDIALDTFPYNGTTTTFEALWMGVPVLTLSGDTHVSRVSQSILSQLSLDRLITTSKEEYINSAIALAKDIPYLTTLHGSLRELMQNSSLFDYNAHTIAIESELVDIWRKYKKQKSIN